MLLSSCRGQRPLGSIIVDSPRAGANFVHERTWRLGMSSCLSGREQAKNWLCARSRQVYPRPYVGVDVSWELVERGARNRHKVGRAIYMHPFSCRLHALATPYLPAPLKTRTARESMFTGVKHRRNSMVSFTFTPWCRQNASHPSDRQRWYWRLDTEASYTTGHVQPLGSRSVIACRNTGQRSSLHAMT